MTARKKKGLGTMISGGIFIVVGAIIYASTAVPAWVPIALSMIGFAGNALGFSLVFPDHD